jgi:hypothetical protein
MGILGQPAEKAQKTLLVAGSLVLFLDYTLILACLCDFLCGCLCGSVLACAQISLRFRYYIAD